MAAPMRLDCQSTRMQRLTPGADSNLRPVSREHDAAAGGRLAILDFHRLGQDRDGLLFVPPCHGASQRPTEQCDLGAGEGKYRPVTHEGQWQRHRHRG